MDHYALIPNAILSLSHIFSEWVDSIDNGMNRIVACSCITTVITGRTVFQSAGSDSGAASNDLIRRVNFF